jgi:hypothetical protein
MRFSVYLATSLLVSTTVLIAHGMPHFPDEIQNHLELASPPSCNLCHGSVTGGGPISQPFGQAMLAAGLNVTGGTTLTEALDQMDTEKTDSNGDNVPDIDSLRGGVEPSAGKPPVEYGCVMRNGGTSPWKGLATYGALASTMLLRALRRRSPRRYRGRFDLDAT